jgi:hypothetical protein
MQHFPGAARGYFVTPTYANIDIGSAELYGPGISGCQ